VTASRIRLAIGGVSSGTPSIAEFEVHLDGGPNLCYEDAPVVRRGGNGACAIHLGSPNGANLRRALDEACQPYDVDFEGDRRLRYIHRVNGGTHVYFFANPDGAGVEAAVRLRGKIVPEAWDPHTGRFSKPEYRHSVEDGQPVTRIGMSLGPVRSLFIVGR
jgi:hypothetical protein